MLIRQLKSADAAAYQKVRRHALTDVPQFVGPLAEQEARGELAELQTRMDNYEAEGVFPFGCFLEGDCAGVTAFSRKLNPKYAHKIFLWGLYVMPAYRGRSVGRLLVEQSIAVARGLAGVRFCTLQVTTTNEPARALYRRFGFESCGIEPQVLNLDGKFYDFEMMQLDLTKAA